MTSNNEVPRPRIMMLTWTDKSSPIKEFTEEELEELGVRLIRRGTKKSESGEHHSDNKYIALMPENKDNKLLEGFIVRHVSPTDKDGRITFYRDANSAPSLTVRNDQIPFFEELLKKLGDFIREGSYRILPIPNKEYSIFIINSKNEKFLSLLRFLLNGFRNEKSILNLFWAKGNDEREALYSQVFSK